MWFPILSKEYLELSFKLKVDFFQRSYWLKCLDMTSTNCENHHYTTNILVMRLLNAVEQLEFTRFYCSISSTCVT